MHQKNQLKSYIERRSAERRGLRETIEFLSSSLPETVIFGGMLRDFALAGARSFSSDVDLVSGADESDIARVLERFSPTRNKFGGFRFSHEKWQFDLWSLGSTWAFRQGLVLGTSMDDLLKTTFFNVDACYFHIGEQRVSASSAHLRGVNERVLEINLEPNPSPESMARRAINMALEFDLGLGPQLLRYLVSMSYGHLPWLGPELATSLRTHLREQPNDIFRFDVQPEIFPLARAVHQ